MNKQPLILGKVNSPVCAYVLHIFQLEPIEINKFLKTNIENGKLNINDNIVFIADKHLMAKNSTLSLIKKTCDIRKVNIVGVIGEDAEIWNKALNLKPINEKLRMNLYSDMVKIRTDFIKEIKKEEQREKEILEQNLNIVNILVQDSISKVEQSEKEILSNLKDSIKENVEKKIETKIESIQEINQNKTIEETNILTEVKTEKIETSSIIKSIEQEDNPVLAKIKKRLDEIKNQKKSQFNIDEKDMPEMRLKIEKDEIKTNHHTLNNQFNNQNVIEKSIINENKTLEQSSHKIEDLKENPFVGLNNLIQENQKIKENQTLNFNEAREEIVNQEIKIIDNNLLVDEDFQDLSFDKEVNQDFNEEIKTSQSSIENLNQNKFKKKEDNVKERFNLSDFLKAKEEPKPELLQVFITNKHNQLNDEPCNTILNDDQERIKILENGLKKETQTTLNQEEKDEIDSYDKPLRIKGRVRSGCRHIHSGDIIVEGSVHPGGELAAKGDIHIYGHGSGRLFAGMDGNEKACIYVNSFDAEIVSIAGNYHIIEDLNNDLIGKSIKISFKNDKLYFEEIKEINKFVA